MTRKYRDVFRQETVFTKFEVQVHLLTLGSGDENREKVSESFFFLDGGEGDLHL